MIDSSAALVSYRARRCRLYIAVAACAAIAVAPAAAADIKAGRQKALQCQACHGLDGKAKLPDSANLAGQNLVKALKDFRSGARKNDMMTLAVRNLTDDDIADLAAYFAAIPVSVGAPP